MVWRLPKRKWRQTIPSMEGNVFLSVKDSDKKQALEIAKGLAELGFSFTSTEGTAKFLNENGIKAESTLRISEGALMWPILLRMEKCS